MHSHLRSPAEAAALARGGSVDASLSVRGKVDLIARYLGAFPRRTLVETGLWEGWGSLMRLSEDELAGVERVRLIDWNPENVARAERQMPLHLAALDVELIAGDSALELPRLLSTLAEPALFWIDAHDDRSPNSPLWAELSAIVAHEHAREHVVLVDDVRMMGSTREGRESWPGFPTLERVLWLAEPRWNAEVRDDVLRLTPRENGGSP